MASYGRAVVLSTLEDLGVSLPADYEMKDWVVAYCPIHEDSTSKTKSFGVNLDEGAWRCFSGCGSSGDLAHLVVAVTGENLFDVRNRLKQGVYIDNDFLEKLLQEKAITKKQVDPLLYDRTQIPNYLFKRGFTKEFLVKRKIGYDAELPAAVIPIRDENGKLVGLAKRLLNPGERQSKYLYPKNFDRQSVVFGLSDAVDNELWIAEGPLDALKIQQAGFSGVSLLGSYISDKQADLIKTRAWSIVFALDNDDAGVKARNEVAKKLRGLQQWTISYPDGIKDPAECTEEQLREAYNNRRMWGLTSAA